MHVITEEGNEQTRRGPRETPDQKTRISAPGPRTNRNVCGSYVQGGVFPPCFCLHSLLSSAAEPRALTYTPRCCDPVKDRTKL